MHIQILGGDLAGVIESADVDSKASLVMWHFCLCIAAMPTIQAVLQLTKGDRVFGLSPDFIFTSKWGMLQ